jgi:hypothetical protein
MTDFRRVVYLSPCAVGSDGPFKELGVTGAVWSGMYGVSGRNTAVTGAVWSGMYGGSGRNTAVTGAVWSGMYGVVVIRR